MRLEAWFIVEQSSHSHSFYRGVGSGSFCGGVGSGSFYGEIGTRSFFGGVGSRSFIYPHIGHSRTSALFVSEQSGQSHFKFCFFSSSFGLYTWVNEGFLFLVGSFGRSV